MALTKLEIRLEAEISRLQKDLDKAQRRVAKFAGRAGKHAQSVNAAFKKIGLAGGVAAGGLALLIKNSLDAGDALAKTADKIGTSTEKLAGLQHAASITGVAQETLNKALTKQQKAIFDANRGLATYAQHFEKLGLSTTELMKLDPTDQFKAIGEALKGVEDQTTRTAIAYDIFGGRGTGLLNTLKLGADGLEAMQLEAEQLGIALNRVDAAKMEEANDTFTRMKGVLKGVGNSITIAVTPLVDALGKKFIQAAKDSGGMVQFIGKGMNSIISAIGFVADAFHGLKVVWKGLEVAFAFTANAIIKMLEFIRTPFDKLLRALAPFSEKAAAALEFFESVGDSVYNNLLEKQAEFQAALAEPMPSAGIKQWAEEAIAEAQRVAEAKAALVEEQQVLDPTALDAEAKKEQEEKEAKHQKKMLKLAQSAAKAKFDVAKGIAGNLASLMNSSSRREFEIGKKAALATAIIKGIEAVQSAYAAGSKIGGPPLGAAFAATAAIATKANIDQINAQQFGGGGGSVSGATTGGSVADLTDVPSQAETQRTSGLPSDINIVIEGGVADRDTAQAIADSLRDLFNDGGRAFE